MEDKMKIEFLLAINCVWIFYWIYMRCLFFFFAHYEFHVFNNGAMQSNPHNSMQRDCELGCECVRVYGGSWAALNQFSRTIFFLQCKKWIYKWIHLILYIFVIGIFVGFSLFYLPNGVSAVALILLGNKLINSLKIFWQLTSFKSFHRHPWHCRTRDTNQYQCFFQYQVYKFLFHFIFVIVHKKNIDMSMQMKFKTS